MTLKATVPSPLVLRDHIGFRDEEGGQHGRGNHSPGDGRPERPVADTSSSRGVHGRIEPANDRLLDLPPYTSPWIWL